MNKIKNTIIVGLVVAAGFLTTMLVVPSTQTAHAEGQCGDVKTVVITNCDGQKGEGVIYGFLKKAVIVIGALIGVISVVIVIAAGIMYMSATDNEAQVKKAKTMISNVVLGIVLFGLMYALSNFLLPGGVKWN